MIGPGTWKIFQVPAVFAVRNRKFPVDAGAFGLISPGVCRKCKEKQSLIPKKAVIGGKEVHRN